LLTSLETLDDARIVATLPALPRVYVTACEARMNDVPRNPA
jgi:hypothetical protein